MAKHGGCFICGSKKDEVLISTPDMSTATSVALCRDCHALPNDALRRKIDAIRKAMEEARRRAAANG